MPQDKKTNQDLKKHDNTRPRNEANPGQNATPTNEKIDDENSPEVRDALNESQL